MLKTTLTHVMLKTHYVISFSSNDAENPLSINVMSFSGNDAENPQSYLGITLVTGAWQGDYNWALLLWGGGSTIGSCGIPCGGLGGYHWVSWG